ncbi:hypothetical protein NliqN6_6345 [Naganishia liquefaciens]|uniref:Uncharacterized protein n=1 Tax=Naganishia liquefaciens TaxID=104408 RepID=A0A8H3U017_9TREE|nr:hypothetical protein NliqN6_6345 [Naganishia liquefaciens]
MIALCSARQVGSRISLRCASYRAQRYLNTASRDSFPASLAFAFDIDGVLKQGPNVLPQAKRALDILAGNNRWNTPIPYVLITNGGGVPDEERRQRLSKELGHELTANQLVQSHTPLKKVAHEYADKDVLVLGGRRDECRRVAQSYGIEKAWIAQDVVAWKRNIWPKTDLVDRDYEYILQNDFSTTQISAILVAHDSHDWGRDITLICELLGSQDGVFGTRRRGKEEMDSMVAGRESAGRNEGENTMPLIFSNPDLEWQSDYPLPRFGQGAFRLAVEQIYKATTGLDLQYTQYGKPHAVTYNFAQEMIMKHLHDIGRGGEMSGDIRPSVYMIGDNPESGANRHGWHSVLLRTGVYRTGVPKHQPTTIVDDVELAVKFAIENESKKAK